MGIIQELKRRNVIRVGLAYGVVSWVLLQIVDVVTEILELPVWAPKLVLLILGIGLIAALVFAWAFEMTPEGIKKESDVDRSSSIVGATGKKLNFVIVASLVIAVVLLLVDRQATQTENAAEQVAADAAVAEAVEVEKSIAVLPFVNMSSDESQDHFSDGITEEILNSLASVKELKVAGRTSSFAFKGQNDDLRRIGEALGVSHILEGSVRKAGDTVRITAQLIQVDSGFHVWSETYDRKLVDVFAIQDEIANEILGQLRLRLLSEDSGIAVADRTDPAVYDLFLKAKQRIYTRSGPEIETAVKELDEAIQLDPQYAPAYAQRGIATMLLAESQYGSLSDTEANRRGRRFLDQALDLNPKLAEAWAGIGLFYGNDSASFEESIKALVKALELNPNLIDASNWLQISLRGVGDVRGAADILEELTERDPLYRPAFANAMMTFNAFGETEKADVLLQRMEMLKPDSRDLLLARAIKELFAGRPGEGLRTMEKRREMGPMSGVAQMFLSQGLIGTGQFERATVEGSPFQRVSSLYALGRKEEAFESAHRFAADGFPFDLFYLFAREGRDKDMTDYLEERWPSVTAFGAENRGDEYYYGTMSMVALAYSRQEESERFDEAMGLLDGHYTKMAEQGVDNFVFSSSVAVYHALRGNSDAAFSSLQMAVEQGWAPVPVGDLATVVPEFASISGDSRFVAIEEAILATVNRNREIVGLPPFDRDYQVVELEPAL